MKKYVIIFCCLMAISVMNVYPQQIKPEANTAMISVSEQTNLSKAVSVTTPAGEPKKVLMHYMGWFGPDSLGRHWDYGQPRKPIIGYYDSQSWATQMYHILLSWSCGIDGLVLNIRDNYDSLTLLSIIPTLKKLRDIDGTNFNYEFAVSFDDQGMDIVDIDTAMTKFKFLRDDIIQNNPNYLRYNDTPAVFIFNYKLNKSKKKPEYLNPSQYKTVIDSIFKINRLKVIWNEIEAPEIANSYYPWVAADSASNGAYWGKDYLDWFYDTIDSTQNLDFATGGVWAGFDERSCMWDYKTPQYRWMNRMDGAIYDTTWSYIKSYPDIDKPPFVPLKWVYIETWNDWNEGSEIEPSEEFGYKYLLSTIKKIKDFKGPSDITEDTGKFLAAMKIYKAADLIERNERSSATYYPCLECAIKYFILNQPDSAILKATIIIESLLNDCKCSTVGNKIEFKNSGFEIYPNPAKDKLYIRQQNNEPYTVHLTDIQGKVMLSKQGNRQLETIDVSHFSKGIYLVRVKQNNSLFDKKIIVP